MQHKIALFIRLLACAVITFFLYRCAHELYTQHYNTFLLTFLNRMYKPDLFHSLINKKAGIYGFKILKLGTFLLCLIWLIIIIRAIVFKKAVFPASMERRFNNAANAITRNYIYYSNLPLLIRVLFIIMMAVQLAVYVWFVCKLPFHYDEICSYLYFSGSGLWSTIFYYPVPNNHVFYNIISSFVLLLPFDEIFAVRIVSVVAAVIATWYIFKLLSSVTGRHIATIATCLFAFSYPVMLYATQGRGYSLLTMLTVLNIYAFLQLTLSIDNRKYIILYAASAILGFYTLPSYLYCFAIINIILCMYYLNAKHRQHFPKFLKINVVIFFITLLLYTPILLRNKLTKLTDNNGIIKRDTNYLTENLYPQLKHTWDYFTGDNISLYFLLPLLIALVIRLFQKQYSHRMLALLALVMLVSPIAIIFLHKTIPFARTWTYLIVPLTIAFAVFIDLVCSTIPAAARRNTYFAPSLTLLALCTCIAFATSRFGQLHYEGFTIDYTTNEYCRMLSPTLKKAGSIGFIKADNDLSFYLAEDLNFQYARMSPTGAKLPTNFTSSVDSCKDDIIVIDKNNPKPVSSDNYEVVPNNDPYFLVYIRKGL